MARTSADWSRESVLVTGCSGFLGAWLTEALLERGASVVGVVRDAVPASRLYGAGLDQRMRIVHGSVEDQALMERAINEYEVGTVFHLAAQTLVTIANRNPVSTFTANIAGTWSVLEACRRCPTVHRVVVASSDKAYGDHETLPYTEDTPLQGRHPYDVSKSCADLIALAYHRTYGLPVCVTRCGNLYGGGDLNFDRIVPGTIQSVLRDERPIIRSDGTYRRDYVFVREAVEAYLLLAEHMTDGALAGEAFNFSGDNLSALDMARKISSVMGRGDLAPLVLGRATGEILHQALASAKAETRLGWRRRFSLEDGLRETIEWYERFLGKRA